MRTNEKFIAGNIARDLTLYLLDGYGCNPEADVSALLSKWPVNPGPYPRSLACRILYDDLRFVVYEQNTWHKKLVLVPLMLRKHLHPRAPSDVCLGAFTKTNNCNTSNVMSSVSS